jgi:hypothetical protein
MTQIARSSLHARVLGLARELWRDLTRDWFGSYGPELHYMRGPGPQWRARLYPVTGASCDYKLGNAPECAAPARFMSRKALLDPRKDHK